MEPERWKRVEQLYHSALALEESRRGAFLDDSCDSDEALRREVASLLQRHSQAEDFMEAPALELMAREIAKEQNSPGGSGDDPRQIDGQPIPNYMAISKLDGGGTVVIYRAQAVHLAHHVA